MSDTSQQAARVAEKRPVITAEVWDGIRLRHTTVESAGQPIEAAQKMAYLSHLDRADLMREVERLRGALQMLYPGLVLDLRYADMDADKDALQSRIRTVEEALSP